MNRLQFEKSPYLLQHADNPVDWYPWGDEAFARAAREDKPVFLSIGYSSCHWCHVMERESFSDEGVAALLNDAYIPVKVDREERPDIDAAYMAMAQVAVGQAGWPLTVIMTPARKPFFIATYIPRASIAGQAGLLELLPHVTEYWRSRKDELLESADKIIDVTRMFVIPRGGEALADDSAARAAQELAREFDGAHGGFGDAPKFPTPSRLSFLLHHWWSSGDRASLDMVTATLTAMRLGGIYDHIGAGFHRYSVDGGWNIPHFEKMLYDQALLSQVYLDAYRATGDEFYADTAREVLQYVTEVLQSEEGGIRSSEDADSEGREGSFYTWTVREMESILSVDELKAVLLAGGMVEAGASTDSISDAERDAEMVFRLAMRPGGFEHVQISAGAEAGPLFRTALAKLGETRSKRVRPAMDDKVVADWNGLAIGALATAGRVLGEQQFVDSAARAAAFILERMRDADGRLLHSYRDGKASVRAFLEDYAFMADGLLGLFQATQELNYLHEAISLTSGMVSLFWDDENGGFFQTAADAETMVVRMKPAYDGALPSGNSVAACVMVRIGRLTDDTEMTGRVDRLFAALAPLVAASPSQFPRLLSAHMMQRGDSYVSIVVGDSARTLARTIDIAYVPGNTLVVVPEGRDAAEVASVVPAVRDAAKVDGHEAVHFCSGAMCSSPVTTVAELQKLLARQGAAGRSEGGDSSGP